MQKKNENNAKIRGVTSHEWWGHSFFNTYMYKIVR